MNLDYDIFSLDDESENQSYSTGGLGDTREFYGYEPPRSQVYLERRLTPAYDETEGEESNFHTPEYSPLSPQYSPPQTPQYQSPQYTPENRESSSGEASTISESEWNNRLREAQLYYNEISPATTEGSSEETEFSVQILGDNTNYYRATQRYNLRPLRRVDYNFDRAYGYLDERLANFEDETLYYQ